MLTALLSSLFAFSSSVLLTNWSIVSWPTLYIVCRTSYSTTFYNIGKILYSRIGKLDRYSRCFLVKVAKCQKLFCHFWSHLYKMTWKIVCRINTDKFFGHYFKDGTQMEKSFWNFAAFKNQAFYGEFGKVGLRILIDGSPEVGVPKY